MVVNLADLLGVAVGVDGDNALAKDVGQPQAAVVPTRALSCIGSGCERRVVPGRHRSKSITPESSSASSNLTIDLPLQYRSPWISSLPSM